MSNLGVLLRCLSIASATLIAASCGGGGGSGGSAGSTAPSSTPPPPPPPVLPLPPPNAAPVYTTSLPNQVAIIGSPFEFDVNDYASSFTDPDGDALTFRMHTATGELPGLTLTDTTISGVAIADSSAIVFVTAEDGRGGSAHGGFSISLRMNSQPRVVEPNQTQVTAIGVAVSYDASQGETTFFDFDEHSLTYEVTLSAAPDGFTTEGSHVFGTFTSPGFVRGTVRAYDGYGGVAEDLFALVVPDPISSVPQLPATSYIYDDQKLALPYIFRASLGTKFPLPDTTPYDNPTTDAGATLGRVLFYDKRLSVTNRVACASCHQQANGFSIPESRAVGVFGELTLRNPMGLSNVRYSGLDRYFSDIRVATLETLALEPIQDRTELANTLPLLIEKLKATEFYRPLFEAAFGTSEITSELIAKALAQFLRSILSYQSKYDQAYHGMQADSETHPEILTEQERRGDQLFADSFCTECHTPVSTMAGPFNNGLDEVFTDPGALAGMFRAGSLRNIAVTAPYMHDGRFATLRAVIDHYDSGVKDHPQVPYQLRDGQVPRRLHLSEEDKLALEAFFHTLTDTLILRDPKFSDPFAPQ